VRASGFIAEKRDGLEHPGGRIREFIESLSDGSAEPVHASAWLMAAYIRGLSPRETTELTLAIRDSGRVLEWPSDPRPLADKHSTGGVGDKISLILAPLCTAMGLRVPMISGRTLGHTGGTLDKLESIPGFRTGLGLDEFQDIVATVGAAMCGQTDDLAPADRLLYSLRDATSTVDSIPLITASILGKKLAEGTDVLVFDVKCGRGAFMKTPDQAGTLAASLLGAARAAGKRARALVTDMDLLLGMTAGNSLETAEALDVLEGGGPPDVRSLTVDLASLMLSEAFPDRGGPGAFEEGCRGSLDSGSALRSFELMTEAQGGDLDAFRARSAARVAVEVRSTRSGDFAGMDALVVGETVRALGGGRYMTSDPVDHSVGWEQVAPGGSRLSAGDLVGLVHACDRGAGEAAARALEQGMVWDRPAGPVVLGVM
jgi:pyrimidine-nucleoside phosphorylase